MIIYVDLNKAIDNVHTLLATSISLRTASSSVELVEDHSIVVNVVEDVVEEVDLLVVPPSPEQSREQAVAGDLRPAQGIVLQGRLCPIIILNFRFQVNVVFKAYKETFLI